MDRRSSAILIVLVIILALIGGFLLLSNKNEPESVPVTNEVEDVNEPGEPERWETNSSQVVGITVSYPPEVQSIESQEDALSILRVGPTQTEGTELYDGFAITFTKGEYTQSSFQEFVQFQKQQAEEDLVIEEVGEIENISLAGVNGYKFTQQGLGDFTIIYLPKGQEYIQISLIVEDPGNLGFQQTVDSILSTLVIN